VTYRAGEISTNTAAARLDAIVEWLTVSLLAFMPLAFGAVQAWSELVVVFAAGAMAACLVAKLLLNGTLLRTWAYLPAGLFIALAGLQLVRLPQGAVAAISPNTSSLKQMLLQDLPAEQLQTTTLSFYTHATAHDLRLLLAAAIIFITVVNVYRRPEQVKRLLMAIACIGGVVGLLALAQDFFGNGNIYWLVPVPGGQAAGGTFVSTGHFALFMNLSMGAALGLVLIRLHEWFSGRKLTLAEVADALTRPPLRSVWFLFGVLLMGAATIFMSLSRAGTVSMLVAGGLTVAALAARRGLKSRGWMITTMAIAAFGAVLYIGFDAVSDRLAAAGDAPVGRNRWEMIRNMSRPVAQFPLVGTGLGTHEVVYPMFDHSAEPRLAQYAENEYVQALAETGFIGLDLLLVFAFIVWHGYARAIRRPSAPVQTGAFGLGFGFAVVMMHSASDFALHVPANAGLAAVTCALLVGMGSMSRRKNTETAAAGSKLLGIAGVACALPVWLWSTSSAWDAAAAEAKWSKARAAEARLAASNWQDVGDGYKTLLEHASNAFAIQPGNAEYGYWLNAWRWRAVSGTSSGDAPLDATTVSLTREIVGGLERVRLLCPTFGPAYSLAGQLEHFVLKEPAGAAHIRAGYQLAPGHPAACFAAGVLDVAEKKLDDSLVKFTRCLELDNRMAASVVDIYVSQAHRPDLAVQTAKDNADALMMVISALGKHAQGNSAAAQARAEAVALLKAKAEAPDAPAQALVSAARLKRSEKDYANAVRYLRRALATEQAQPAWRLELADVLAEMGRTQEAIQEAQQCLRMHPRMAEAMRLIARLSGRPKK